LATSPLSVFRFRWAFYSSWLLWALMHVFVLRSYHFSWTVACIDSLVFNAILLGNALLLINTLRFYIPQKNGFMLLLAWVVILTFCCLFLSGFISSWIIPEDSFKLIQQQSWLIRFCIGFLINATVVLLCVLWYNWQEQQERINRNMDTERMARDAELYKLRQQMQPHFLFNSLNSINALITIQPEAARKMVLQLSDFLRSTLKKEERQWVALEEEMHYLQLYLDIEKVRFGHRLTTIIHIDESAIAASLPALILQPLVENAIKFGLYDTIETIEIKILARKEENHLVVQVENPFDPDTAQPAGTGFGLSAIRRRMYLLFGRQDLLITETHQHTFTTTLKIPQQLPL
jgi:sensor histidine kinase YesM